MSYDDISAAYMAQPVESFPAPELPTSPARRLRDALEPIATQGWWSRPVADRIAELGLDFFAGYVWGRAAALGEPDASVVVATFGVFEAPLIGAVYEAGRAGASRVDVLAAREAGAAAGLGAFVADDAASALAEPLLAALASLDGMGRPLFSALRALPLPSSPAGRLWRAAELVREHRGDGHLAAAVALGFEARSLNVLTELWLGYALGEYSSSRGMSADDQAAAVDSLTALGWMSGSELTELGRVAREDLEVATDVSEHALVEALGASIESLIEQAAAISDAIVEGRSAPTDPRKRAAG